MAVTTTRPGSTGREEPDMTDEQPRIVTTTNEEEAVEIMRRRNRAAGHPAFVLVDGPDDGEFTVMPLDEAVDNGFLYRWEA